MSDNILENRHDFLLIFEVTNGNPNGDPDAGNLPRLDPNTNRGFVSDVCLKRKIRNYVEKFPAARKSDVANGFDILIKSGTVIENEQTEAEDEGKKQNSDLKGASPEERAKNWLCREFYDVRTFGAVVSTGKGILNGSPFGQVQGPVQLTFAQSFDPITPLEITITRCCVTKNEDEKKERTMGNKYIVPYALYAAKGYGSPAFAERTGFTKDDLRLLFEAILNMFEHDRAAGRGEMIVRGLYDFEHCGTQHPNNAEQNKREARVGCFHSHKLFEGIKVSLKEGKTFPQSYEDYKVECAWNEKNLPPGIKLNFLHEPAKSPLGPIQG